MRGKIPRVLLYYSGEIGREVEKEENLLTAYHKREEGRRIVSHHARIEVKAAGEGHKLFSSPSPPMKYQTLPLLTHGEVN